MNLSGVLFAAGGFAIAGAICAAVPIIIHLLNRRRFKVVNWAAMDFLRQALQRNRRIMQIRDLILMALRTAAVLLFGLALAQPSCRRSPTAEDYDRTAPLHAILVVDNSMSMGYQPGLEGTTLDLAKEKATDFIKHKEFPAGSCFTVVPLCGSPNYSLDPYRTASDAIKAVEEIETVDRSGSLQDAANLAVKASEAEPNMAKRVVFFSDQQAANWDGLGEEDLKQFPSMQIVEVAPDAPENSWISDFRLEDGIADVQTPCKFTVRLRHEGLAARKEVPLSLWVKREGKYVELDRDSVDLQPGTAEQEVVFRPKLESVNISPEVGKVTYVPVKVTLGTDDHDRLADDNERFMVVPVVAAVPVVFVDQFGADDENASRNSYGETWQLRRLLVPIIDRNDAARQLVRIEHVTLDQLTEDLLADARLVVIAGVDDPSLKVDLLREYVEQGGQLFIAAGGQFNPQAWSSAAWLDGKGILPAPLEGELVGTLPGGAEGKYEWFELDYNSEMKDHAWFRLGGEPDDELAALYSEPFFFQAAQVQNVEAVRKELLDKEVARLSEQLPALAEAEARIDQLDKLEADGTPLTTEQDAQLRGDRDLVRKLRPTWLDWKAKSSTLELPDEQSQRESVIQEIARGSSPRVLARFNNGVPYMVERHIGEGDVLFCSSGIKPLGANANDPGWNTIARTYTVLMFDRALRSMIRRTLSERNFVAADSIPLPLEGDGSGLTFELQRPAVGDAAPQPERLLASLTSSQTRGVTIHNPLTQGIYEITAYRGAASADANIQPEKVWQTALAVNATPSGDAHESQLDPLAREKFDELTGGEQGLISLVGPNDDISLAGATITGHNWWRYFAIAVLALLLVEIAILAWPALTAPLVPASEATA